MRRSIKKIGKGDIHKTSYNNPVTIFKIGHRYLINVLWIGVLFSCKWVFLSFEQADKMSSGSSNEVDTFEVYNKTSFLVQLKFITEDSK